MKCASTPARRALTARECRGKRDRLRRRAPVSKAFWLSEAASAVIASGVTPNLEAIDAMMIGRRRRHTASTTAPTTRNRAVFVPWSTVISEDFGEGERRRRRPVIGAAAAPVGVRLLIP